MANFAISGLVLAFAIAALAIAYASMPHPLLGVLLHWELGLGKFLCPGCWQLPGTTVARRGEPPLWEVELKKA